MKTQLLFAFLFAPLFLIGQSVSTNSPTVISIFGNVRGQFIDFSDLNQQLESYNLPGLETGAAGLVAGVQLRIPGTALSTSLEASFAETCPDHTEEGQLMPIVSGHGFKLRQAYTLFDKNGWALIPSIGVGYQKLCLNVDGQAFDQAKNVTTFIGKSCTSNYYTDYTLGFEKGITYGSQSKGMYFGGHFSYRNPFAGSYDHQLIDQNGIDWSATKLRGMVMEFSFRIDVF